MASLSHSSVSNWPDQDATTHDIYKESSSHQVSRLLHFSVEEKQASAWLLGFPCLLFVGVGTTWCSCEEAAGGVHSYSHLRCMIFDVP